MDEASSLRHHPLRTTDADGHDRHAGTKCHVHRSIEQWLNGRSRLAFPLGEQHDRFAGFEHGDTAAQRLTIRAAASHGEASQGRQQPPERTVLPERVLAHEEQPAAGQARRDRRVDVRPVDRREHEGSAAGQMFPTFNRHPRQRPRDEGNETAHDEVEPLADRTIAGQEGLHLAQPSSISTIVSTTSAMGTPVVSTTTAPPSGRNGPSIRVMSRRSRSAIEAATSPTSPPISRTRRAARSWAEAVT